MKNKNQFSMFGYIFWIHIILDLILYCSWFLFSWWLILIGAIILQIQYIVFNGCVLTKAQFGKEKNDLTCIGFYLDKIGFKFKPKNVKIVVRYISPIVVLIIAILWQVIFHHKPFLF